MGNPKLIRARVIRQGTEKVLDVMEERDKEYGDAWKITGEILAFLLSPNKKKSPLFNTHFVFNWAMILNKLCRALITPNNPDHWLDIAGYATLVYEEVKDAAEKDIPSE